MLQRSNTSQNGHLELVQLEAPKKSTSKYILSNKLYQIWCDKRENNISLHVQKSVLNDVHQLLNETQPNQQNQMDKFTSKMD